MKTKKGPTAQRRAERKNRQKIVHEKVKCACRCHYDRDAPEQPHLSLKCPCVLKIQT